MKHWLRTWRDAGRRRFHAAVDWLCYILTVRVFVRRTLLLFAIFFGVAALLHLVFGLSVTQESALGVLLGAAPKLQEVFIAEFKGFFTADKAGRARVKQSVQLHVGLLQTIERPLTAQNVRPPDERTPVERDVIVQSLRLIDSVLRERVRLYEDDDVRTSLGIAVRGGTVRWFYEKKSENRRSGYDISVVHNSLWTAAADGCVDDHGDPYRYTSWPDLAARRYRKALRLPAWHSRCGARSGLMVRLLPEDDRYEYALIFESRRAYEFGSRKQNERFIDELTPFFIMVRLALQYRDPATLRDATPLSDPAQRA